MAGAGFRFRNHVADDDAPASGAADRRGGRRGYVVVHGRHATAVGFHAATLASNRIHRETGRTLRLWPPFLEYVTNVTRYVAA